MEPYFSFALTQMSILSRQLQPPTHVSKTSNTLSPVYILSSSVSLGVCIKMHTQQNSAAATIAKAATWVYCFLIIFCSSAE